MYLSLVFVWRYKSNKEGVNWFFFSKAGPKRDEKICLHPLPPLVEPAWLWYSDIPELRNRKRDWERSTHPPGIQDPHMKKESTRDFLWSSSYSQLGHKSQQDNEGTLWRQSTAGENILRKMASQLLVFLTSEASAYSTLISHISGIFCLLYFGFVKCAAAPGGTTDG